MSKKISTKYQYDSFITRRMSGADGVCIYGKIEHRSIPIAHVYDKVLADKILEMLNKEVNGNENKRNN